MSESDQLPSVVVSISEDVICTVDVGKIDDEVVVKLVVFEVIAVSEVNAVVVSVSSETDVSGKLGYTEVSAVVEPVLLVSITFEVEVTISVSNCEDVNNDEVKRGTDDRTLDRTSDDAAVDTVTDTGVVKACDVKDISVEGVTEVTCTVGISVDVGKMVLEDDIGLASEDMTVGDGAVTKSVEDSDDVYATVDEANELVATMNVDVDAISMEESDDVLDSAAVLVDVKVVELEGEAVGSVTAAVIVAYFVLIDTKTPY